MKMIVVIEWTSSFGRVQFRPRYSDGTVGLFRQLQLETNDPRRFQQEKSCIETELVGKAA